MYGKTRDEVYDLLKENGFYARRYFYPLISEFPTYKGLPSAGADNLPVASQIAKEILCLPIYPDLDHKAVMDVCNLIKNKN